MAKEMKTLAKDTAIYGVSSILGKFLNWLLVPLYTYTLEKQADYGIVTNLYAWTALLLVVLTYGMETGYFRFANKETENADKVYGNSLLSVGFTSLLFTVLLIIFNRSIANALGYSNHSEFIWMLGLTVAMDAFSSIPFAYLRFIKRPIAFAAMKFLYIVLNIVLNLFFLVLCPWLMKVAPNSVSWFYDPHYGVGYIFISNLIATTLQTLILSRYMFTAKFEFDFGLLKKILNYSYPLLFLGIAGIANQNLDKILFPFLQIGEQGKADLGVYGAVSKIAMVIMMFTQAFRYAYEPFVFAKNKDKNSLQTYSEAMKFFVIFSLLIFLGMVLYMDLIKFIIKHTYWAGLDVVPIILFSFIFQGIFFNLSIWYKLTDRNHYGAWFSAIGTVIIFVGNIIFVPMYSYWGSAWSAFAGYFIVMLLSYFFGQKFMPINYNLKKLGIYLVLTLVLFGISTFIETRYLIVNLALKTVLMAIFIWYTIKTDFPLKQIPYLNKFSKTK
ncbi:Polysaccharide biosynthesis protein [uncultured Paludibacter sp.]|nr:Polysaccharide biosynthesis protein [uncultured Paludibacter sp.]